MAERHGEHEYDRPERSRHEGERHRGEYGREPARRRGEAGYGAYGGGPYRGGEWDPEARRAPWEGEGREESRYGSRRQSTPEGRGFFDRAGDELRSWFGDDEARRRRRRDEREDERGYPGRERGERGGAERSRPGSWGFGPWPGGRHLEEEWRQWGTEPSRRPGHEASSYGGRPRWTDWADVSGPRDESWETSGPYAGRGPRNYQRSDARISEDVCERLTRHGELDASDIEVQVTAGEVILQGTVESRWAKRLAEDLAADVSGVRDVTNRIRVASAQPPSEESPRGPAERGPMEPPPPATERGERAA